MIISRLHLLKDIQRFSGLCHHLPLLLIATKTMLVLRRLLTQHPLFSACCCMAAVRSQLLSKRDCVAEPLSPTQCLCNWLLTSVIPAACFRLFALQPFCLSCPANVAGFHCSRVPHNACAEARNWLLTYVIPAACFLVLLQPYSLSCSANVAALCRACESHNACASGC
jgi:hypothetical protein